MIATSFLKWFPTNFFIGIIYRYKFGGTCGNPCSFILNFFKFIFPDCVQLSQMLSPYSNSGLINAMYMASSDFLSRLNFNFLITLILNHAFSVICLCFVRVKGN